MARSKILMKNWPDGFVRILNDLVYKHKICGEKSKNRSEVFVFISGLKYIFCKINLPRDGNCFLIGLQDSI